ncbi:MAG: cupin domain-containing protein [Clostridiales bacterium]|nr:cupin domain-containing protein [Clostridiales bacterium]
MIINFDEVPEIANKEFKGGKLTFYNKCEYDGINKIMMGRLEPGASIGLHTHYNDSEVIYFLEGHGTIIFDDDQYPVGPGLCHYCPKGHDHSLVNSGDEMLRFFSVIVAQ